MVGLIVTAPGRHTPTCFCGCHRSVAGPAVVIDDYSHADLLNVRVPDRFGKTVLLAYTLAEVGHPKAGA